MSYVTQKRIETVVPAQYLLEALDDDGDGQMDDGLMSEVIESACQAVDALLSGLFAVPFADPAPAAVAEAAFAFACERIYERRGGEEKNPYKARANYWRERLGEIGSGKRPLDASSARSFAPGAAVKEESAIDGSAR